MNILTREKAIAKLKTRIKSIELMRKHKFLTVDETHSIMEYNILTKTLRHVTNGGAFEIGKGFIHCVEGRVNVPIG